MRALLRLTTLPALLAATACGNSLDARITPVMDACVAVRNPVFVAGGGATALDQPLGPAIEAMANDLRYKAAFERLQDIAKAAPTQAVLVCALEIAAHDRTPAVRQWLTQYTAHPNEPVQIAARRLLEKQ